jgi:transglutaminase-like putative cysteine protease
VSTALSPGPAASRGAPGARRANAPRADGRRRSRPRQAAPVTVATALLLSAAALAPLVRVFGPAGLRLIALTVPAAALVTAGVRTGLGRTARGRRSPLPVLGGFAAGLVAGAVPAMLLAAADPVGPAALGPRLADAVTDGWRRLLSVPVPAPATRSFTDLPVLLAAALTAIIVLAALGERPAAALVPATLGFGGLLTLGVNGPASGIILAACYALAALAFLLAGAGSGVTRRRGVAAAAGSVLAIAGVAVLTVAAVNPGPPYDPRAALRLPLNVRVSQDPLALLPELLETPHRQVLSARLSGALLSHPGNWLVLAYTGYAGAGWQAGGAARPAPGGTGAAASGTGRAVVTSAARVALLPHPPNVLGSVPEGLGYDAASELLASPRAIRRYTVTVSVPEPSARELRAAVVPPGVPPSLTAVPVCLPSGLRELADQARRQGSAPGEEAVKLQQELSSAPFRYDKAAAPGEGCGSLDVLMRSGRGTVAQFATAFALAARTLGLPARIAVGYTRGMVSGDTVTVTDADAYAWPQVLFGGIGWVTFDPAPKASSARAPRAHHQQPLPHQVPTPSSTGRHTFPSQRATAPVPAPAGGGPSAGALLLLAAAAVAGLALGWVTAVRLLSARRRRRRRRAAEPADRVLGAWDELLIPLAQAGTGLQGRSAPRVADSAVTIAGDEAHSVAELAVLAERALYGEVGEFDATTAWRLSDRARRVVAAAAGRPARLRRLVVPSRRR